MAEDLRIFGTNFNIVNALRVTTQGGPQILYTTGDRETSLLQNKTVTPGIVSQTIEPDEAYYGLASVIVDPIPSSYVVPTGQISITRNGTFNVGQYASARVNVPMVHNNQAKSASPSSSSQTITADAGYDGLSSVTISAVSLQNKTVSPTTSSQQINADSGYNGLGTVTVSAIKLQSKSVTPTQSEQTITADSTYNGLSAVKVNAPNLQNKTITPTKSTQTTTPDSSYTGLGIITINPIPDNYITTDDATAGPSDIVSGWTAYVNGEKITGTFVARRIYESTGAPSNNMGNVGDIYIQMG